jgi:broad-specificity NMP kinase
MTYGIYLLGAPGVGKSTVMRYLMKDWTPMQYMRLTEREMFGHYLESSEGHLGVYLGRLREQFPGTDALSMSVQPQALKWVENMPGLSMVFGEGSRLGNATFLSALADKIDLAVTLLTCDEEVLRERRASRPDGGDWKTGRKTAEQAENWAKGQATRAANAAEALRDMGYNVMEMDTTDLWPDQIAELVVH